MGKKLGLLLLSSLLCGNLLAIHQVKSEEDLNALVNKGDVVLRCTMDGCHFCVESEPAFEASEKANPNVIHARAKLQDVPNIAKENKLPGAPSHLFYKQGSKKPVDQLPGYSENAFQDKLSRLGRGGKPTAAPTKAAPMPRKKMAQEQQAQPTKPMGPIKKLTRGEAELLELLVDSDVLLAMTMQGCGACAAAKKELPRIQAEHPEIVIVEADLRDNPDLTNKHNITAAPTFLFHKKGSNKPHDKIVGANMPEVEKKIKESAAHKQGHGKKAGKAAVKKQPAKKPMQKIAPAQKQPEAPAPKKMTKKQIDRAMARQKAAEKAAAPVPAPRKRAMPMKAQKPPRGEKKFVEQQIEGIGCKTSACGSCEPCKGGSCNI